MHAEARNGGTTRAGGDGEVFQIDGIADPCEATAGKWSRGNAAGNRSAVEFGEQWVIVLKGVGLLRVAVRSHGAALEEPGDATENTLRHADHLGVAGRGHAPENDFTPFSSHVDPVQGHYVWFRTMSSTFISA
jgi:hypothetical protein